MFHALNPNIFCGCYFINTYNNKGNSGYLKTPDLFSPYKDI